MPKKPKTNYKYFIITSGLIFVAVFFVVYFWKAYFWQLSINQALESIQFEPNSSQALTNKVIEGDPLITPAREVYTTLVKETDPAIGDTTEIKSKLLIVEFGDLTDKATREIKADIDKIISKLEDKVVFVWKDFPQPFNKESRNTALAARCAQEQESFWEYVDMLWQQDGFDQDIYISLASRLGLDITKFSLCFEEKTKMDLIGENMQQAQNYWVEGVPHLFVGGRSIKIDDNYSYEKLERIVGEELIDGN